MILRLLQPHPALAPHVEKMWRFESESGIPEGDLRTIVPNGLMKVILSYRGALASSQGGSQYALFPTEDRFNAGALVQGPNRAPSSAGTLIYLDGSPDLSQVLRKVATAGGRVLMEKTLLSKEAGYTGLFVDSEGNSVGLQHM